MNKEVSQEIKPETLLTSYQAGSILQVNPSSVNKWVKDGRIPAFRTPGGHRRIRASDLVAFLNRHQMPIPGVLTNAAQARVLILVDNPDEIGQLQRLFTPYAGSLDVHIIDNGVDALVQVGAFRPNLVVLDVEIAKMDGFDVCRRLHSNNLAENMVIIMMASRVDASIEARAQEAGAKLCVSKPLQIEPVLGALGMSHAAQRLG